VGELKGLGVEDEDERGGIVVKVARRVAEFHHEQQYRNIFSGLRRSKSPGG